MNPDDNLKAGPSILELLMLLPVTFIHDKKVVSSYSNQHLQIKDFWVCDAM
jgi:hypothetical protein